MRQELRDELHKRFADQYASFENWECNYVQIMGEVIDFSFLHRKDFSKLKLNVMSGNKEYRDFEGKKKPFAHTKEMLE